MDRDRREVVLFSEPTAKDYSARHQVVTGKPLPLPAPFGFDLDTGRLL